MVVPEPVVVPLVRLVAETWVVYVTERELVSVAVSVTESVPVEKVVP